MKRSRIYIAIFALLLFSMVASPAFADHQNPDLGQIVFVSEPDVFLGDFNQLHVQAQTLEGETVSGGIGHTACIRVTSTSDTGLFSHSSNFTNISDVLVTSWAENSANRTFYYKDTTPGNHTLSLEFAFKPEGGPSCNIDNWPWEDMEVNFTASQEINMIGDPTGDFCQATIIGESDLVVLLYNWGLVDEENSVSILSDFSGDGNVGVPDLLILLSMWEDPCDIAEEISSQEESESDMDMDQLIQGVFEEGLSDPSDAINDEAKEELMSKRKELLELTDQFVSLHGLDDRSSGEDRGELREGSISEQEPDRAEVSRGNASRSANKAENLKSMGESSGISEDRELNSSVERRKAGR